MATLRALRRVLSFAPLGALLLSGGCSETSRTGAVDCSAGERDVCIGTDDCSGVRECQANGTFGECVCAADAGGSGGSGVGGSSGGSSSAGASGAGTGAAGGGAGTGGAGTGGSSGAAGTAGSGAGGGTGVAGPCPDDLGGNVIFVTSRLYDGLLSSGSTDEECEQLAAAAGLGVEGASFRALTGGGTRPSVVTPDPTTGAAPILNRCGEQLASNWAALWEAGPETAVRFDQSGVEVSAQSVVWTGLRADGTHDSGPPDKSCNNWTASDQREGGVGSPHAVDGSWVHMETQTCASTARLYCLRAYGS